MARKKRSQEAILERTNKKRRQEDALLESGTFEDAGELSDSMIYESTVAIPKKAWDDEEQDYELVPRKIKDVEEDMVEGLPIKINGKVERNLVKQTKKKDIHQQKETNLEINEQPDAELDESQSSDEEEDTEERIIELKEDIADLVEKIMEDPEENTMALTRLCKMAGSRNPNTAKFSILALVPVFNSIIPGYRIRPLTDLEKKEKISKEVAKLRTFEQNLVQNYKSYVEILKNLSRVANNDTSIKVNLGVLATQAALRIISNASHFNFRADIFTLILRRICKPNLAADPIAHQAIETIEGLFNADDEGGISLDIVRILCKIMKVRNYNIEESVLNMLLSLDVLHDYDPNTKDDDSLTPMKLKKKDRVHLSKKQRKMRKEMKEIEKEMEQAEQVVSAEEREKNQSQILKSVLALYLNILRNKSVKLIGPVLEGLAKFGNMANFDLLGDFLVIMKEIINDTELDSLSPEEVRKVLLCIVSAFSIVSNNSNMKISIDLTTFADALYSILPYVSLDADIELSYKSLRLADPLNNEIIKPSVNVSTKAELLLKALDHVFFRSKSGSKQRAAAYTKRLYTCMQHTPEKTTIALLKFIDKLMNKYPELCGLYSTEDRIANGNFNMETDVVSRSNPDAATLWEHTILTKHYCPTVVKGVRSLGTRSKEYSK
ncbi:Noc3p NDAI_0C02360 [Naumovozyma dairenensis CBS 421]|uniref:Nucleolar complex-associated protein 3 n=1 Tax=Naumovozyma dairenensis (strain ATCC 10597 / BCRC 20456 / CBS 421 / NBRC 0211 / NRRL Y-12639) TaxID=1071378 RepID=G0W7Y5_NAUDC|nr:hypothetical protein NDAI_0C02360 [Naumovozyma dairenensis CBS 421]CCD23896.1 hypothetical protein NDAI_0C02360 [Naumovozyma dairenensis CBS 421]